KLIISILCMMPSLPRQISGGQRADFKPNQLMTNKQTHMQRILTFTMAVAAVVLIASCGSAGKDDCKDVADMKKKLEKLKKDKSGLDMQIRQLEEQLAAADPSSVQTQKLVALDTVGTQDFAHFI